MSQGYELPADFADVLKLKFDTALSNNDILLTVPSTTEIDHVTVVDSKQNSSTVDVQLTLLESLVHRPEKGDVATNPFANPEPQLTVVPSYGPNDEFTLVYNKFPVVPYHFMMITKEFASQNSPLTPTELMSVYSILNGLEKDHPDKKWFSFYNCGPESGASQPHKHVQFMTLPENFRSYAEQLSNESPGFIPTTSREPLQKDGLPHAHFVGVFPDLEQLTEDDLSMYFTALLQRTLTVLRENESSHISYNFIMTTKYMLMVPRSKAKYNDLGINSCGVLGLVLCKNSELLAMVKETGFSAVMENVGFPSTAGQTTDEYHY
jgi:ATP adenylyltransferase